MEEKETERQILRAIEWQNLVLMLAAVFFILSFAVYAACKRTEESATAPTATGESVIVGPGQTGIATKTGIVVRPSITVTGRVTPVQ